MSSAYRFLPFALIISLIAACSSGPTVTDEQELVDEDSALALLQTPDVLGALRVDIDDLSTLTPLLERLAEDPQESGDDEEWPTTADSTPLDFMGIATEAQDSEALSALSSDPIGYLAETEELPNELPSLATDRSAYILLSHLGNLSFIQAAMLGLPTIRDQDWPAYVNVRVLLPSSDPESLMEELGPWLDNLKEETIVEATQLFEGPDLVRLEMAVEFQGRAGIDGVDAGDWLDDLQLDQLQPPATADFRPTPAYDAFVDGDAPLAGWAPIESLAILGTFESLDRFARDYDRVGPTGQPRYFMEGISRLATASVVDDPVAAENEDVSLLLSAHDADTLVADFYATRTEQGARIYRAMDSTIDLSEFATQDAFINLEFQADLDGLEGAATPPYWTSLDTVAPIDFDANMGGMANSLLPFTEEAGGFVTATMALQYPWTGFLLDRDLFAGMIPRPRALALEGLVLEEAPMLPLGVVAAGAFPDTDETRQSIRQLLQIADANIPGALDAELVDRDDEFVEVRLVWGLSLREGFAGSPPLRTLDAVKLSLHLDALDVLDGMAPEHQAPNFFDHIHVRSHSEQDYQTHRLSIGNLQALEAQPVTSRLESLRDPSHRCRTEIAAAAVEHLTDLSRDPMAHIEAWAKTVEERAQQCMEPTDRAASLIQERIDLAWELADAIP